MTEKSSIAQKIVALDWLLALSRLSAPFALAGIVGVFTFEATQARTMIDLGTRLTVVEHAVAPLIIAPSINDRLTTIETHSADATKNRDTQIAALTDQVADLQRSENTVLQSLATILEHLNNIDKTMDRLNTQP